jgi:hypothetical protein
MEQVESFAGFRAILFNFAAVDLSWKGRWQFQALLWRKINPCSGKVAGCSD